MRSCPHGSAILWLLKLGDRDGLPSHKGVGEHLLGEPDSENRIQMTVSAVNASTRSQYSGEIIDSPRGKIRAGVLRETSALKMKWLCRSELF
jgi:hypothetical protein